MILTFRLVSDEVDNFKREIKIDSTATFTDLMNVICESVGYEKNRLSSFYLCDSNWEREKEITFEDMGSDPDQDIWLMDESSVGDFVEDEGQKVVYVFDYLTDRAFYMEMTNIEMGKSLRDPYCSLSLGQAPPENVDIDEFDAKIDAKASMAVNDMDENFYGDEGYNSDEFDADGYDEMNLDE